MVDMISVRFLSVKWIYGIQILAYLAAMRVYPRLMLVGEVLVVIIPQGEITRRADLGLGLGVVHGVQ